MMPGLGRLKRYLRDLRVSRIHNNHRSQHAADYMLIDSVLERFRGAGGLKHDYQGYKLFSLQQLLRAERPQRILELGSGTSTAIFADYVRESGAELWSVDESADWIANSRLLAAINSDAANFHLIQANKHISYDGGRVTEIGYDIDLGDVEFDLVLVDGPSLRVDGKRYKTAINPDVFAIVNNHAPDLILVDIRSATVDAMAARLADQYDIVRSDVINETLGPNYQYFTEFRHRSIS